MTDILANESHLYLGSRMKRLAERLQAEAAQIIRETGLDDMQAAHMPIFSSLEREDGQSVSSLVDRIGFSQPSITRTLKTLAELGYVRLERNDKDQRQKHVFLTDKGRERVFHLRAFAWPRVAAAARDAVSGLRGDLLTQLGALEAELAERPLPTRDYAPDRLEIVAWDPAYAEDFYRINEEWVSSMFKMEPNDVNILENPQAVIIDKGGEIWFVRDPELGIIGTLALLRIDEGVYELTKMGVSAAARGKKAGETLLAFVIDRARRMQMKTLFLLTNKKCEPAIHLYEKLGFKHDAEMLAEYSARYERCNVAMRYPF